MRLEAGWRALDANAHFPDREGLLARAMKFLPSLDAFAPQLVEEVRGIADGAGLSFAEALLVNVRAEVIGLTTTDQFCTAFAIDRSGTANRSVLSGQNLDQHPLNRDLMIILHVEPDGGPAMLMWPITVRRVSLWLGWQSWTPNQGQVAKVDRDLRRTIHDDHAQTV